MLRAHLSTEFFGKPPLVSNTTSVLPPMLLDQIWRPLLFSYNLSKHRDLAIKIWDLKRRILHYKSYSRSNFSPSPEQKIIVRQLLDWYVDQNRTFGDFSTLCKSAILCEQSNLHPRLSNSPSNSQILFRQTQLAWFPRSCYTRHQGMNVEISKSSSIYSQKPKTLDETNPGHEHYDYMIFWHCSPISWNKNTH